jgi:uncharacterized protein
MMTANPPSAHYPYQVPVTAYGNSGFRFAEMSHRGSLLCLPTGMYAWAATDGAALSPLDFITALRSIDAPAVLLLGTGATQFWPSGAVTAQFAEAGIGLEPMTTGAAARTYNILLAERRPVSAALIAVP